MIIAAVSGGPDSIALCEWLEKKHLPFVMAHVNYHHRPSACRDEAIVRQWADAHHKMLITLHPQLESGNFQHAARKARYDFFVHVARMFGAKTIAFGHQQDDAIETWMMQKERGGLYGHYGLCTWSDYERLRLFRPLLPYTKADIQKALDEAGIIYGIDESNLSNAYRRNQIRHSLIETADADQRKFWLEAMQEDEAALRLSIKEAERQAKRLACGQLPFEMLCTDDGWRILDAFFFWNEGRHQSKAAMLDLVDKLSSQSMITQGAHDFQLINGMVLVRKSTQETIPFFVGEKAVLEAMCVHDFKWNGIRFSQAGKTIESFFVIEDEFPLLIRPWKGADRIVLKTGTKKISRLLIDRKVPALFRRDVLVIESTKGLLYAQHAGCDRFHYVESGAFYMVKLPA